MKNNSTLSIVAIIAALFVLSVVAYADTGPPGNSGQVVVGPGHAGYHVDIGPNYNASLPNLLSTFESNAFVLVNPGRHVFRDSASNPAVERAAPSNPANLVNSSITRGEETPQVIVSSFSTSNTQTRTNANAGPLQDYTANVASNEPKANARTVNDLNVTMNIANSTTPAIIVSNTDAGPPIKEIGNGTRHTVVRLNSGEEYGNQLNKNDIGKMQAATNNDNGALTHPAANPGD